jgi:ABC-type antimicrobial peptide transport system permease subunit
VSVVARTHNAPAAIIRPFIESASGLDQNIALLSVKTMRQRAAVQLWPFRTVTWMFAICGVLALFLSTTGLAGVVMHAVTRRFREFGVRMAVGATRRDLIVEVLRGSARLLVPGLAAGIVLALIAARLMQAAFHGVHLLNPLTYLAVVLLECAIVGVASISPALRAARVNPLDVLRAG